MVLQTADCTAQVSDVLEIHNPATGALIDSVRAASPDDVVEAVQKAQEAFESWSQLPVVKRCRILFTCKEALEQRFDEIAELIIKENGKPRGDAVGELRRGLEVLEFACGMPSLAKGDYIPDIAESIDGYVYREPLGVVAGICPFNFPAMIPMWMFPLAIACGNTFVLKPSDKCPLSSMLIVKIMEERGLPAGVLNIVNGDQSVVDALINSADVKAVSFVGSTPVAKQVWQKTTRLGKRCQAMGGAKNYLIVTPDADPEFTCKNILSSAYGCAGERCMATSVVVLVGDCDQLLARLVEAAAQLRIGNGMDSDTDLGPLISAEHRARVEAWIDRGVEAGAELILDGRLAAQKDKSCFLGPCILDKVEREMTVAQEEIFGPVLSIIRAAHLSEAITVANQSRFGNGASLFTGSGAAARQFRNDIECGMVGINVSVPAPMAFFSFGGHKDSMFGDLKVQGTEGIDFYTKRKVITERWMGQSDVWAK